MARPPAVVGAPVAHELSCPSSVTLPARAVGAGRAPAPETIHFGAKGQRYVKRAAPTPESLTRPATHRLPRYYVVAVGQRVGVFSSWPLVKAYTDGVPGAEQYACTTWDQALDDYKVAYDQCATQVRILVNGPFYEPRTSADMDSLNRSLGGLGLD
ncbi:hypothetical protein H0H92_008097 [Tricholoma furcatifolium]|nr:hypothetical protein H0H92_008097 [Tricholoma furcatifolium]